jgi:hypothetical protein
VLTGWWAALVATSRIPLAGSAMQNDIAPTTPTAATVRVIIVAVAIFAIFAHVPFDGFR